MSNQPEFHFRCVDHGHSTIPCSCWSDEELRDMGYPAPVLYQPEQEGASGPANLGS